MATRVGRGKIQLVAFDAAFPKTPPQMQISRRYLLHKPSCSQFCPEFRCHGNGGRSKEAIGSIRWPVPENLLYRRNFAKIFYASRVIANLSQISLPWQLGSVGKMRLAAFDGSSP